MGPNVHCIIMGGGRGTRLYPLTKSRCKPAVPLAGKYRLVDVPISTCIHSGFNKIYLLTQFNTASLHRHVQGAYRFDRFGGGFVEILSAEQTEASDTWYQGTADAVRQNLIHFDAADDDVFVILSGDQLFRMDLKAFVRDHLESGAGVTVAAKPIPVSEASGLGLLRVDDDGEIVEFVEKPTDPDVIARLALTQWDDPQGRSCCLASMGIYAFGAKVLHEALSSGQADFGKEIIPGLVGNVALKSHIFDHYWEDIGTVKAFFEANLRLVDPNPPFDFHDPDRPVFTYPISNLPSGKVETCSMERVILTSGSLVGNARLRRCVVGVRSVIGDDVVLEDVVLMGADLTESTQSMRENIAQGRPAIGVGAGSEIRRAIVDKNARIGCGVRLSPGEREDGWVDEEKGLYVRDGILIIIKNAVVPDNYSL
jgi:glucose-1-phosphate adenylyltransferase